jgi:hypothetical protein
MKTSEWRYAGVRISWKKELIGSDNWNLRLIKGPRCGWKLDISELRGHPISWMGNGWDFIWEKGRCPRMLMKLELPRDLRIHPVHHVSLLDPVAEDPLPGQKVTPPSPAEVNGNQEYQVEQVDDSRMYQNQLQYLVRWTAYDQMTWEPARDIDGLRALDVFHEEHP